MAKDEQTPLYTTGDLARMTGNTLRTVRYYEELGLLAPVPRRQGAHRLFTPQDLERLRTITDLRATGLSLEQVAEIVNVQMHQPQGGQRLEKALNLMDSQLEMVRERLQTLQRVEKQLSDAREALARCKDCPSLGAPQNCTTCDTARTAQTNGLVGLLLHGEQESQDV